MKRSLALIASGAFLLAISLLYVRTVPQFLPSEIVQYIHTRTTVEATTTSVSGKATLIFVGDMFFDRYIRKTSRMYGEDHSLACADEFLRSGDVVVGNLEGPITDEVSVSEGTMIGSPENYQFTFPSTTAPLLLRHNIRVVDLGNNHIANFGREGQLSTKQYLQNAGVGYFGGVRGDEPVLEKSFGGIPFAFLSYNAFLGAEPEDVALRIRAEKEKGNTVIVFAHWGDEYSTSTFALRPIATEFVSSGASLIVGAHPHVVLPHETIDGVPVYYSLGNFVFDQYWNDMVTHGLALRVEVENGKVSYVTEHETRLLSDGSTCMKASL